MADFCKQCSIEMFGTDTGDLAGLSTPADTAASKFAIVLCEGCGPIAVDHEGNNILKTGLINTMINNWTRNDRLDPNNSDFDPQDADWLDATALGSDYEQQCDLNESDRWRHRHIATKGPWKRGPAPK